VGTDWPAGGAEPTSAAIAVIAHPAVPVDELSLGELRQIFLGDRQFWSQGLPVTLLVPAKGAAERATLLSRVYDKTEVQYRHYWIAKVFRAEATSAPKIVPSERVAGELVRGIEGAITVVEASRIPAGVKVLAIDGKGRLDDSRAVR